MRLNKLLVSLAIASTSCAAPARISHLPTKVYVERHPQMYIDKLKEYGLTFPGEPALPSMEYKELDEGHAAEYSNNVVSYDPRRTRGARHGEDTVTDTDNTIYHEFVHFNNDKLRKKLGLVWHSNHSDRLVEEGTAEFIANTMTKTSKACYYYRNVTDEEYALGRKVYDVGSCIVGPIIEKYKEPGIMYMLVNLPTDAEVADPYKYRDRMLVELERGNRVELPKPIFEFNVPIFDWHF